MARVTSSSNRNKRKTKKPITQGQNPQRPNRQKVSQAKVTSADARKPSPRSAGINKGKGAGLGRVTGTLGRPKPPTPANVTTGKAGGALVRSPGGALVRSPGGALVRNAGGALVRSPGGALVRGGMTAAQLARLGTPIGAALAVGALAKHGVSKEEVKRTKGAMPGKPTNRRGGGSVASQQRTSRAKAAAAGSTSKFKGARDAAVRKAAAIKGSPVVGPRKASQPAASSSKPKQAPKASAPKTAQTKGIGPVKSGESYARQKGSLSETARKLREMRKESQERQKGK